MSTHRMFLRSLMLTGIVLCISLVRGYSQDDQSKWALNGYVKYLQSATFGADSIYPITNSLFHNRLNIKYFPNDKWTFALETRNRLFIGEEVKLTPHFGDQINQYNGLVDLGVLWMEENGVVLHSIIDRAYVNYTSEKFEIRLGRQRINWGIDIIWNPNDLFNALNFLDFDYEERPGSDAIRVQYYTGPVSSLDVAFAPNDTLEKSVAAALYKFNTKGYDIQLLVGYYRGDLAFGGGWAGSIKNVGFKGEATFFQPLEPSNDSTFEVSTTVSFDYLFGSGLYLSGGILYNSSARNGGGLGGQNGLFSSQTQLSAKNLFPAEWALSGQVSGNLSPLTTLSGAILYAPENHLLALIPTVTYSIKENWDIDLVGQAFFIQVNDQFTHLASSGFLRLKWSF